MPTINKLPHYPVIINFGFKLYYVESAILVSEFFSVEISIVIKYMHISSEIPAYLKYQTSLQGTGLSGMYYEYHSYLKGKCVFFTLYQHCKYPREGILQIARFWPDNDQSVDGF